MSETAPARDRSLRWAATVAGITFVALLVAAALRSAPSVLMMPLQLHFGWDRATISLTAAVGIFLYGFVGPFAAALMMSFGIRRTMIAGLSLMATATFASQWMSESWQFLISWGVFSGIGSGAITSVLGAAVVNRWFAKRQGLVMGLLERKHGHRIADLPASHGGADARRGMEARGARGQYRLPRRHSAGRVLRAGAAERCRHHGAFGETPRRTRSGRRQAAPDAGARHLGARCAPRAILTFWLLFATFFVCGLTTNGLVGVHMIAFCGDHGIAPVAAAGLLTTMGLFDLVGTTASGWLTDRFDL